eukprot:scaffold36141_cov68-Phaeocystis_antarctica.AAC.2
MSGIGPGGRTTCCRWGLRGCGAPPERAGQPRPEAVRPRRSGVASCGAGKAALAASWAASASRGGCCVASRRA